MNAIYRLPDGLRLFVNLGKHSAQKIVGVKDRVIAGDKGRWGVEGFQEGMKPGECAIASLAESIQ